MKFYSTAEVNFYPTATTTKQTMNIKKADTKWGEFDIYYEVNPPDRDTGCPGYNQITEVFVQGVDVYDDLDNIPGAIEFLEREVEEERR